MRKIEAKKVNELVQAIEKAKNANDKNVLVNKLLELLKNKTAMSIR